MKRKPRPTNPGDAATWLLLVHQLPAKPAYLRVKIWRRLQGLGAVALKNSVYVLPASAARREDLEWLLREIERDGGEAVICAASLVDGMTDAQLRGLFNAARDADYAELAKELRAVAAALRGGRRKRRVGAPDPKLQLPRVRRRFAEVAAIDFFSATGRLTVEALLREAEAELATTLPTPADTAPAAAASGELTGRTWVTRRDIHVDRIACAWLVRRFIDKAARFKFVAEADYVPAPDELRFDMYRAEFTHEGDRCSFEVLLERIGLADPALRTLAEIVHDLDLKDGKFARAEAAGIAHVIAGICLAHEDDLARLERGGTVFDEAYESFRRQR